MKKKTQEDKLFGPQGDFRIIPDFLPSFAELAEMDKKEKITLNLDSSTLKIFRKQAKKYDVPYQVMIRNLLNKIAQNIQNA